MSACTFHLVRHAEHEVQGKILAGRLEGIGLSHIGQVQADTLARRYASEDVRAILSSPLARARATAAPIAVASGLTPCIEPGLDEIDFGSWSGCTVESLAGQPEWEGWNRARTLAATPGGETMLAVQARAVAVLMRARVGGGAVVAVSHADVIKAVLAWALGISLDLLHRLEVAPASRSMLVLGADWARVEAINLPP